MAPNPPPTTSHVLALTLVVVTLGAVCVIVAFSSSPPTPSQSTANLHFQTCLLTTNLTVNGTVYSSCNATLYWMASPAPPSEWFAVQHLATVSFQGVLFNITGYNTMDCPVVNVTGTESTRASYSFLIYPAPFNCQFTQPTVFSPDNDFGATWTGGSSIQVLVRVPPVPLNLREQTCPETTNVTLNGGVYWACNATLYWNSSMWGGVQHLATVSFEGVLFNITGYNTVDCPVVNVTGREPTGATYSFLLYPQPMSCQFTQPTTFSPDNDFGATWTGGSSIQVLVRVQ